MTIKRGLIYAAILGALLTGYWILHRHDRKVDQQIASTTLAPSEVAKVVLDPGKHMATLVTKRGVQESVRTVYLPPHTSAISVNKDGSVKLETRTWGTERSFYLGGALGTDISPRAALGLNLLYVQRWELGGGLLANSQIKDTRIYLGITYNATDNLLVGLAIDNRKTAHLLAGLRF